MDETEWHEFPKEMKYSKYKISKDGKIWSKSCSKIKLSHSVKGYYKIELAKDNGETKIVFVHRLLAEVFIKNPKKKKTVDHIDRNRTNNDLSNLRWATMKEQNNNKIVGKTKKYRKISQYDLEGKLIKIWNSIIDVANYIGMSTASVHAYLHKQKICPLGYLWKYAPIENLPNEEWKEILELPTYFVSSKGRIKYIIKENVNECLLKGFNNGQYFQVGINYENYLVHVLVCLTFNGKKPNENYVVNHLDGNKLNNEMTNLEWETRSGNSIHAFEMGLVDKTNLCKPVSQFDLNGKFIAKYPSISNASKSLNISASAISSACTGKTKTSGKFKWLYTDNIDSLENVGHLLNLNNKNKSWKSVSQFSLNDEFISSYQSITIASKSLNINASGISSACNGIQKTAGDFKWKYNN